MNCHSVACWPSLVGPIYSSHFWETQLDLELLREFGLDRTNLESEEFS